MCREHRHVEVIDGCCKEKDTIFGFFVDFSRAYDCVPKINLLMSLKRMGCEVTMLVALAAMYREAVVEWIRWSAWGRTDV